MGIYPVKFNGVQQCVYSYGGPRVTQLAHSEERYICKWNGEGLPVITTDGASKLYLSVYFEDPNIKFNKNIVVTADDKGNIISDGLIPPEGSLAHSIEKGPTKRVFHIQAKHSSFLPSGIFAKMARAS